MSEPSEPVSHLLRLLQEQVRMDIHRLWQYQSLFEQTDCFFPTSRLRFFQARIESPKLPDFQCQQIQTTPMRIILMRVLFFLPRYGKKSFVHDRSCEKKRERMLRRYPPPEGWQEVGDPDT